MRGPIVELREVNSGYGKFQVLFDVNLDIPRGEITVIVGPNGAGKSTLLSTIFDLTTLYRGRIIYDGTDVTREPPYARARRGMAYVLQLQNVFFDLTVWENLRLAGYDLDDSTLRDRLEEVFSLFPRLKERLGQKARTLSGGEKQMLAIGIALVRRPKLLMLDEPTAALAPKLAREVLDSIVKLRDLGYTIVLAEQNTKAALEVGDKAVLIAGGRVVYYGEASELLERRDLIKTYLGLRA